MLVWTCRKCETQQETTNNVCIVCEQERTFNYKEIDELLVQVNAKLYQVLGDEQVPLSDIINVFEARLKDKKLPDFSKVGEYTIATKEKKDKEARTEAIFGEVNDKIITTMGFSKSADKTEKTWTFTEDYIINFGKHKGNTIKQIISFDRKYILWIIETFSKEPGFKADLASFCKTLI